MPSPSIDRVKEVFEQWAMYDAVVQADYMQHAEIVSALAAWTRQQREPLRIVDLGCGDAYLATHAFREAAVAQYEGVDVSESAIERAREHVAIWPDRAHVTAGNLAEFLCGLLDGSANAVLASYSLHHFLSDAKRELIAGCHRILVPGGSLIWIDAVRRDDESRDAYIARLTHTMEQDWTALSVDQRARACAHVRESDFPETGSWMRAEVARAGFDLVARILRDDYFVGWVFSKRHD
jgi:ubiquinone/menaquinone biosynthesis C-methylase UbiE